MLLLGTEQINCISLEFPLLHQSPLLVDVGEKRHGWPRYLSESCLMRQGVQGELSQDALCTRGGLWGFPSSHGYQGGGGPVSPQECVRWHLGRRSYRLIVRYLFQSVLFVLFFCCWFFFQPVLKQTLALMDVIAWDRTSAEGRGKNLQDAA